MFAREDIGLGHVSGERLTCVLANPPTTTGARTLSRVDLATRILGYREVNVVNLFSVASSQSSEISKTGAGEDGWLQARPSLTAAIGNSDGVLLAYGHAAPSGPAREHHRQQVAWLRRQLGDLPVWQFGGSTRHPSRWQRWTHRQHPDLAFEDAVRRGLQRC